MLKSEFEERFGCKVSNEVFDHVNEIYMNAGKLDKDTFCGEYKVNGVSETVEALNDEVNRLWGVNSGLKKRVDYLEYTLKEAATKILKDVLKNDELNAERLADVARTLVGADEVIKMKLSYRIFLSDEERNRLIDLIEAHKNAPK